LIDVSVTISPSGTTSPDPLPMTALRMIKRAGRIARLRIDCNNPKWKYMPRSVLNPALKPNPPQTVTFNEDMRDGKGSKIPLTSYMDAKLLEWNGADTHRRIHNPPAGWINTATDPEALTWAANDVVVKEIVGQFADVHAMDCNSENVTSSFFTADGRLEAHKFNAITPSCTMIKLAEGYDCFTPFIKNSEHYWINKAYLEFWPELPCRVTFPEGQGVSIVEYVLRGYETWAINQLGTEICLHTPRAGYLTDWKLETPGVPV
jgi:hypothetical protein